MAELTGNIQKIREYFSVPGYPVTIQELKALTAEDRAELARLIDAEKGE